jgi:hypothetical protein
MAEGTAKHKPCKTLWSQILNSTWTGDGHTHQVSKRETTAKPAGYILWYSFLHNLNNCIQQTRNPKGLPNLCLYEKAWKSIEKCHQCGYQFGLWLTMTLMISWATQLKITVTSTLASIKWIFWQKILSRYVANVCSTWDKLQMQYNRSFDAQVYRHNSCITESSTSRLSAKQNGHQNSKLLKNHAMCVQIN